MAHVQQAVEQHAQVLFHQQLSKHCPQLAVLHGVVTQGQDPAPSLVAPLLPLSSAHLSSLSKVLQINTATQPGVFSKLTEGPLDYLTQVVDENIKQDLPLF